MKIQLLRYDGALLNYEVVLSVHEDQYLEERLGTYTSVYGNQ